MSSICYLVLLLWILKPETFSPLHILYLSAKYEELYAFSYNPKQNESEQVKGWQLIDLAEEYKRMGVPNAYWQLSDANRDYKVSVKETHSSLRLFLMRPIENSLILWDHLACNITGRVNSLISQLPNWSFSQGLIERACVHECVGSLGLFEEYT